MADALLGLIPHPLSIVAHIFGEALSALPCIWSRDLLPICYRPYRGPICKFGRDLDHGLIDQHRHRVKIAGVGFKAKRCASRGSEPPPAKGSWKAGRLTAVKQLFSARVIGMFRAGPPPGLPDLITCLLKHDLIGSVFPFNKFLDNLEQALPLQFSQDLV